jgi:hypothetical protein
MITIIYILFILAFIVHDGEEIAVVHKWVMAHGDDLCEKHPMLRRVFNYLRKLNTKAFAIAALEELIVLIAISAYAYIGGPYAIELWSAAFMAFSLHLIVHIGQAIVVRGYVPGLVTSVMLLPFAYHVMQRICTTFNASQLLLWAVVGIIFMVANLAFAHWLGFRHKNRF